MSEFLTLNKDGAIARIVIDHPPANTWTEGGLRELARLVGECDADGDIRALILTGQGERFFSAGADVNIFAAAGRAQAWVMVKCFGEAFEALGAFGGVSIAAINGFAIGGGLEAALACDIRIAADTAQMALPEAKIGLLPGGGGTQNLPRIVGEGWAARMILCGEQIDARRALQIGLVEEVVAPERLMATATTLAQSVAAQSPSSVAKCKQLIQMGRRMPRPAALAHEREMFVQLWDDDNRAEGCNAFLQKRKPQWRT